MHRFESKNNIQAGNWIIGSGYDHTSLQEKSHPTKQMLDVEFPKTAVVIQHKSGHFGVFNTTALKNIGFDGKDKNGYLEENEYITAMKKIPLPDSKQLISAYKKAMDSYASYGITTIQEGMMIRQMLPLYQMLIQNKLLSLDVVGYPQISDEKEVYTAFHEHSKEYLSNFRLGGYKIILDGSPQGKTAWMKTPYAGTKDYYGVSSMQSEEVENAIKKAVADGRQILAHCNGDAAVEQFLNAAESAVKPHEFELIRPVIIHGQLLAKNQLARTKKLGIIPSFFVAHCYYWGDTHIQNFGFDRAAQICPAGSALHNNILFTFHQDTPVVKPNMLETVQCAVTRETKNGVILGSDERISVYEALKAVTINAAYQYGEEKTKGSIAIGKKADFIIMDANPLEIKPENIKKISILETYKSGTCIYKKYNNYDPNVEQ